MKRIPVQEFDKQVEVIVIKGPKNTLTIGPIFQQFKKLQILRIIDSNIPAIGINSFWGIPSLRILGKFLIYFFRSYHDLIFLFFFITT